MTERAITPKDNQRPPIVTAESLKADYAHLETELAALEAIETPPVLEDEEDLALLTKTITDLKAFEKKTDGIREDEKRPIIDAGNIIQSFFKVGLQQRALARAAVLDKVGTAYLKKKAERERLAREAQAKAAAEAAAEALRKAEEAKAKTETAPGIVHAVEAIKADAQASALTAFANAKEREAAAPMASLAHTRTTGGTAGLQTEWTFDSVDLNIIDLEALRPFLAAADIEKALRAYVKSGRHSITGARIFETDKARWRK